MQFALLISVIVALILGAFILLTHTQSVFKIKSDELISSYDEVNQLLLEMPENISYKDTIVEEKGATLTKLHVSYHGLWLKANAEIIKHGRSVRKTALIGTATTPETVNLYLCNTNSPLVVVGNTRLEGNVYLPQQGIKAGNISGNYYQGTSLYYGKEFQSNATLPELHHEWMNYIKQLIEIPQEVQGAFNQLDNEVKNSFQNPVTYIFNPDPVFISNQKLYGNIIIQSLSSITISGASDIQDVIFIAPKIKVENGVTGIMQLIATKNLEIGKNCQLRYPSSATLLDTKIATTTNNAPINRDPDFTVQSNTIIEGAVLYLRKDETPISRIKTNVKIEPDTEIKGEVYCQGNLDIQGTVYGSLYANQFTANQSGSIYLNHLYNTKVLVNPVEEYSGIPFSTTQKNLAKWLY